MINPRFTFALKGSDMNGVPERIKDLDSVRNVIWDTADQYGYCVVRVYPVKDVAWDGLVEAIETILRGTMLDTDYVLVHPMFKTIRSLHNITEYDVKNTFREEGVLEDSRERWLQAWDELRENYNNTGTLVDDSWCLYERKA